MYLENPCQRLSKKYDMPLFMVTKKFLWCSNVNENFIALALMDVMDVDHDGHRCDT